MRTAVFSLVLVGAASAQHDGAPARRTQPWSAATVAAVATLPVQDEGRIKPFSALAATSLYTVHGRRDMQLDTDGDGKTDVTLTPTEWLLDVWCYPDQAADYPLFRIENVDVLDSIGVPNERGQRFAFEYLTFRQLMSERDGRVPAETLQEQAHACLQKDADERTPVETHLVETNEAVGVFHTLHQLLAALQAPFRLEGESLRALYGGRPRVWLGDLLVEGRRFADLIRTSDDGDTGLGNALKIAQVLQHVVQARELGPALFPPSVGAADAPQWLGIGGVAQAALSGRLSSSQQQALGHLQRAMATEDHAERERELVAFRDTVAQRATDRGEYGKVELEDYYLQASWHYRGLHYFLLAILVVAIGWAVPRSKWLWRAGIAATVLPLLFLVVDIVLRCVIRGRPPILNLYDTFLFIGAVGVIAAIVAEVITRRRVAMSLAPIFGALIIAFARKFEVVDGKDQLHVLQAVLDTNYWLATHVTSINMGYAAGMFASLLGLAWLWLQAFGFRRADATFHRSLVRATYGVTAFGLIFAVFATAASGPTTAGGASGAGTPRRTAR
jgi:hypothetical protein